MKSALKTKTRTKTKSKTKQQKQESDPYIEIERMVAFTQVAKAVGDLLRDHSIESIERIWRYICQER
jgi:hypothetical protein